MLREPFPLKQGLKLGSGFCKKGHDNASRAILPIYSVGEAPQKSNRKFDWDLENQTLFFKPDKKTKLRVEFHVSKKQQKVLNLLQSRIGEMPIAVRLSEEWVWITYDEEKLAGYEFKKNG